MNKNKIYFHINSLLDSYLSEGIKPEHLLNFLNVEEENYKFIYNRLYRKLTLEDVSFESNDLTECLVDSIRDKIAFYNDTLKSN